MDNFRGLGIDGEVEVNPQDIVSISAKGTYTIVKVKKENRIEEVIFYLKPMILINHLAENGINTVRKSKSNDGLTVYHYE